MYASPQGEEGSKTPEQKLVVIEIDNEFSRILKRLDAALENYSQLRLDENVLKVQDEMAGTENRINVARIDYNDVVRNYNSARGQARMAALSEQHKFAEEPYFESDERQSVEPRIKPN